MFNRLTRKLTNGGLGAVLAISAGVCFAEYPEKPVRIIVPYGPGGGTDTMARVLAQKLSSFFNQPFVVENKPGADGIIGVDAVAKALPDGYTLLYESTTAPMTPFLHRKVPYDVLKDIQPVGQIISYPYVVVANPSVPATSLGELVQYLKANGNKTNVASGGSSPRVLGELFKQVADVNFTFIPYKGGGPAVASVLSGETQLAFQDLPSVAAHVKSGRLRAIAVTSDNRTSSLPGVPTAKESGLPEFTVTSWHGLFAPAGTPTQIVSRLNKELNRALDAPDVKLRITALGADPAPNSTAEFTDFFRTQVKRWKTVIERAKIPLAE